MGHSTSTLGTWAAVQTSCLLPLPPLPSVPFFTLPDHSWARATQQECGFERELAPVLQVARIHSQEALTTPHWCPAGGAGSELAARLKKRKGSKALGTCHVS